MKKMFDVTVPKRLQKTLVYVIVLDFALSQISFHKVKRGKEVQKKYQFSQCVRFDKNQAAGAYALTVHFQTVPVYKKTVHFADAADRELFCNLMHAGISCGSQAFALWSKLVEDGESSVRPEQLEKHLDSFSFFGGVPKRPIEFVEFLLAFVKGKAEQKQDKATENSGNGVPRMTEMGGGETKTPQNIKWLFGENQLTSKDSTTRLDTLEEGEHIRASRGVLYLTNYRLLYIDYIHSYFCVDLPLGSILRANVAGVDGIQLQIFSKDYRVYLFQFDAHALWVKQFLDQVMTFTFPKNKDQTLLFAFSHNETPQTNRPWLSIDGLKKELSRSCLMESLQDLRLEENEDFMTFATYPAIFVVAAGISHPELLQIAGYRSRARIPAVVWRHPTTNAVLARCAQPLGGVTGKRCEEDEKMFALYREAAKNKNVLYIVDARPRKAAVGNRVMGKGTENTDHYIGNSIISNGKITGKQECKLLFMGIDNIHAIRDALGKVIELTAPESKVFDEATYLTMLSDSKWLYYLRLVLKSAVLIVQKLEQEQASVVVHCSDGWDRTAQLTGLTQLILDPYYRSMEGFMTLIEKEWLHFGHKFQERCGHADPKWEDQQRAPIFLQWVDAVWQMSRQFPTAFEFNESFLITMLDHVTSCRFGTFLFNNAKERHEAKVAERTPSLWQWMLLPENKYKYQNALYSPAQHTHVIPSFSPKSIVLWETFFLRYDRTRQRDQNQKAALVALSLLQSKKKYEALRKAVIAAGYDIEALDDPSIPSGDALLTRYLGNEVTNEPVYAVTLETPRPARHSATGTACGEYVESTIESDTDEEERSRTEPPDISTTSLSVGRRQNHHTSISAVSRTPPRSPGKATLVDDP